MSTDNCFSLLKYCRFSSGLVTKGAMKIGRRVPVLIEVNVAGEETKFGVAPEEVEELIRKIAPFEGIER